MKYQHLVHDLGAQMALKVGTYHLPSVGDNVYTASVNKCFYYNATN